jgi:hypothetical protein
LGHIHLAVLPSTKKWKAVVALLEDGAATDEIIEAAARAAERDFHKAAGDAAVVECVRLLGMIPVAAREPEFGRALRSMDILVSEQPDLMSVTAGAGQRLDRFVRDLGHFSDIAELARRALLGSLTHLVGDQLPSLFEVTPDETRTAFRRLSQSTNFSRLSREFFTRLVTQTLSYWLDRTLATHIGPGRKFRDAGERAAFDAALRQYGFEATRIIKEFSGGWYGKTLQQEGAISQTAATRFTAVALKKTVEELRRKRAVDA